MRRSLVGHVVPLSGRPGPEPAATQALCYVLNAAPEIASAFVELLTGGRFEIGRIACEWKFDGVQPDVAVYDAQGAPRLFVENKFWAALTDNQPVAYLDKLPSDGDSTLAFIAPKDRAVSLWDELQERCRDFECADEAGTRDVRRMRVGERRLVLTSWGHVLDAMMQAAHDHPVVQQDIVQLRGLTESMTSDEVTDQRVPRRIMNYAGLIDPIVKRLIEDGVADVKGLMPAKWGRYLGLCEKRFVLWFGISFDLWRDSEITPLWIEYHSSNFRGDLQRAVRLFDGAQERKDNLYIPIRLATGVERDRVIDDAVRQMHSIADRLADAFPPETDVG